MINLAAGWIILFVLSIVGGAELNLVELQSQKVAYNEAIAFVISINT
jgi:hypothetical protein